MAASAPPFIRPDAVRIHGDDNVAVAIHPLSAGDEVDVAGARVTLRDDVPAGHKFALRCSHCQLCHVAPVVAIHGM